MFGRKKNIFAQKRRNRKEELIKGGLIVVILLGLGTFFIYPILRPINYSITVEAGTASISPEDFVKNVKKRDTVTFDEAKGGPADLDTPGEYRMYIDYNDKSYNVTVNVEDTIAPVAEGEEVVLWYGTKEKVEAIRFAKNIKDATKVTAEFVTEPDDTKIGTQTVLIRLTDEGENTKEVEGKLTITDDQEAPMIYGAKDRTISLGTKMLFDDGIAAVDDRDKKPQLTVDSSKVDLNTRGKYPIVYTAKDSAGNTTTATIKLTVGYPRNGAVDIDQLNEKVDELLKEIMTDSMSEQEKCRAVYDWTKENIKRSSKGSDKTNWMKEAYRGLEWKSGDSFTAASLMHACFLRMGMQDMIVEGSSGYSYWNLVNYDGEKWLHVDGGNPHTGLEREVFLLNQQQLAECSVEANGFYDFDTAQYPASR